ncbi:hypothetical protein NMG60_11026469 [Bertholletia excelsa]
MEQEGKNEPTSPLPLQFLEEKQSLSTRCSRPEPLEEDHCKPISSAIEEVHHKGTLMERLEVLENRVFELSITMEKENTSRSSSSAALGSEKFGHSSGLSSETKEEEEEEDEEGESSAQASLPQPQISQDSRRQRRKGYRKWLGWLPMGC